MPKKLLLAFAAFFAMAAALAQPGFTCADPIEIGLPYSTTDSSANYGDTVDSAFYLAGNDVFYAFTPVQTGYISIILDPVDENASITVFLNCGDIPGSDIASVGLGNGQPMIIPSLAVTAGVSYYIVISSDDGTQTVDYSMSILKQNCLLPSALDVGTVGQTTAELSWNPGSNTAFEVAIQPEGSGMPTGSGVAVTGASYSASGLDSGTTHEYWVRSDCGDGTFSIWAGPQTFWTYPANSLCPTANQCDYIFKLVDTFGDSWNGNSVTVRQNGTDVATLTLDGNTDFSTYDAVVPLCTGGPFELFWNAGGSFPTEVIVSIINPFGQTIYHKPDGVGSQNSLLFQGIADCSGPICQAPSDVHFTDLSAGSATVAWTELGTATEWEVLALPTGSPAPTATDSGIIATINPFMVTGLIDGGEYDFYVRAVCSGVSKSDWTLPVSAVATCPLPIAFSSFGGDVANAVSWQPGLSTQWEVIVQSAGLPAPDVSVHGVVVDTPQYVLDSTAEGIFDVYVRAVCSSSDSVWSAPFSVEITCAQASDITITGNVLSWTANGSAAQWQIRVYEGNVTYPGGSVFDLYTTSANPFVIPDMIVGQDYTVFVRSVCGPDDSGVWSSERHFIFNGLGNPEIKIENFIIYPNPAGKTVAVTIENGTQQLEKISLLDMVGKTVYSSKNIGLTQTVIDVSSLAKGIYLMEIETSGGNRILKKLIKE